MPIAVGSEAPFFELKDATGNITWALEQRLQRGPVVLAFYQSSCRASKITLPFLECLARALPTDRFTILGIALDSPNVTLSFARRYAITFPLLPDGDGYPTARAYDIVETPTIFLIDPAGRVLWQSAGFDKGAIDQLSELLASAIGVPPVSVTVGSDDLPARVPG